MYFQFILLLSAVVFQSEACPCRNSLQAAVIEAPITSYYQPAAYPCAAPAYPCRDYTFPTPNACGYASVPAPPCGCTAPTPAPTSCARNYATVAPCACGNPAPAPCACGYSTPAKNSCGCAPAPCSCTAEPCGILSNPCDLPTCGCFKDICDPCKDCAAKPKPTCECLAAADGDCERLKSFVYFPEVEYPLTIYDSMKPFYYNTCFGY